MRFNLTARQCFIFNLHNVPIDMIKIEMMKTYEVKDCHVDRPFILFLDDTTNTEINLTECQCVVDEAGNSNYDIQIPNSILNSRESAIKIFKNRRGYGWEFISGEDKDRYDNLAEE